MCWFLPAILFQVYCSPAIVGVFAAIILVSVIALFWHLLSVISDASHHHLRVALDHGILDFTLSLLLPMQDFFFIKVRTCVHSILTLEGAY